MKPLLLFDIDGTLMRAHGAGERAMEKAGKLVLGEQYTLRNVSFSGGLDPLLFHEGARQSGLEATDDHHARFREAYLGFLAEQIGQERETVVAMPGAVDLLRSLLDNTDVVLGLLTGNYREGAHMKLRHVGIDPDWFRLGAFGDLAPTRPELLPIALTQYQALHSSWVEGRAVIVIGDTPKDVHCAQVNGCQVLAVATGNFTLDQLRETGADRVVEDLASPEPLLELLAEAAMVAAEQNRKPVS